MFIDDLLVLMKFPFKNIAVIDNVSRVEWNFIFDSDIALIINNRETLTIMISWRNVDTPIEWNEEVTIFGVHMDCNLSSVTIST